MAKTSERNKINLESTNKANGITKTTSSELGTLSNPFLKYLFVLAKFGR